MSRDRSAPAPDRRRWLWTPPQRRTLAVLILLAGGVLGVQLRSRQGVVTDPPAAHPRRFEDLDDRLDPNLATVDELAVLPGIGPSKARGIVAFRQAWPDPPAFRTADDLARVGGIGEAMVAKIAPHLAFPDPPLTPPLTPSPAARTPGSAPAAP